MPYAVSDETAFATSVAIPASNAFAVSASPRMRPSPFMDETKADGVATFSVYNRMLVPTSYGDPEAEYWQLLRSVAMWDVGAQRQIELYGPDAARLAQMLVPRKLADQPVDMGWYVPICDHRGTLLNDPILLKLAEDRFWFSIADSDILMWARGVAVAYGMDVTITEPDVSPLAVQGPKAEDVVASLFGDDIRKLRYFQFTDALINGIPLKVARSGWSKQGGFELYLMDGSKGTDLWNLVKEAGQPFGIRPGCPNPSERIESGLLSYGGDTDDMTNPFEVRMGKYVDLDCPDDTIGIHALRRIHAEGPRRHQLGIKISAEERLSYFSQKCAVLVDGRDIGMLTATAWSYRLEQNIGLGLIDRAYGPGTTVTLTVPGGASLEGELCKLPFF